MPRLTAHRERRGFTMAELLITITLLGFIGTVVAKLMLGQQRFYHSQTEQIGVRRELRTAMSLLPADLRALSSSGGDLTAFDNNSITFRNVLGAGVVCDKPGPNSIDIPPLDLARNVLTSWYTQPQPGDSVYAFNEGMLRGAEDDSWVGLQITSIAPSAALCPLSVFTDPALDAGKPRWRITVAQAIPDSVKIGAGIRFVRSTRYALTQAGTSNQWYLSRSEYIGGGWTEATPVSGPYEPPASSAASGIRFQYFDSLGTSVSGVANSRNVARIDLVLRARGYRSSGALIAGGSADNRDSLAFRVALRNRQ